MDIVADACEANVDVEFKPSHPLKGVPHARKRRSKERGGLYLHSEASSSNVTANERLLRPCNYCRGTSHRLRHCAEFKKLRYTERLKLVNREKLCHVCLNEHGGQCKFKIRCNIGECREFHNPLMHPVGNVVGMSAHIRTNWTVMFRIIPVQLYCGGKSANVLAFLDEGDLVEKKLADRLGAVGVQERLTIRWTGNVSRVENTRRMNLRASGTSNSAGGKMLLHTVHTVGKLMLPHQKLDSEELVAQYKHMRGLPIESYDGQPQLLIGANNIHSFAPLEAKVGTSMEPIAVRTKLGWTVYGPRQSTTVAVGNYLGYHQHITNDDLHELLKSHYALEESVVAIPQETAEERRAREILERTTRRVGDRFETGLLWKNEDPRFPDSFPMALRRMKQLENKLGKNPVLHENVCRQIEEYQQKGYAHGTPSDQTWYLPLNVVQNPKKPGKIRLVWDAAATVRGVSLNSKLLSGPDMLVPLVEVLSGFREWRIAFGGDLKEMFHQLQIRPEDKQKQRDIRVDKFPMLGAVREKSEEFAAQYPEASAAIIHRHYVDDYFDSVDNVEAAIKLAKDVRLVHLKARFEIRNWVSNSPTFLRNLGEEKPTVPVHFCRDKQTLKERVLGVIWDPKADEFSFSTMHQEELQPYLLEGKRPTKRLVASCHLWHSNCGWDDEIDEKSWMLWQRWINLLPEVETIRIPRCHLGGAKSAEVDSLEVHIFTDASEHAYGCVAYLRAVIEGEVRCSLMMSRAKVAPIKRQSIPRLELMGAVLGARLSQTILSTHSYHRYQQFVAFRVGEIQELTKVADCWAKLLRVAATVVRFIANCRRKIRGEPVVTAQATAKQQQLMKTMAANYESVKAPLRREELQQAETILWRQAQWDSFPDEMSTLTNNLKQRPGARMETIKKSSQIQKSSPTLDDEGVLRMDGRLENCAESSFDKRHPIILPRSHAITQKLIQHYHEQFGHGNSKTVFNEMRQRFQIPKMRPAIQQVVSKCIWCKVNKCRPRTPRMAPLPVEQVTSHLRPFSSVGLDYLGPVEVTVGRRREKRWVAVFTCLAVRAVHLEVVHSLTTESCRMAITRFRSKFGKPSQIFSDNATCFRGANNEMVN
ncbi:uncharacterized protein LOC134207307 [Armigeres subalbatus]|uniref:uncharacterized protein LOC134207307 n=1 Tax=Armigeres subalbatus TaxID=124917 RepID=UPI002ED1894F